MYGVRDVEPIHGSYTRPDSFAPVDEEGRRLQQATNSSTAPMSQLQRNEHNKRHSIRAPNTYVVCNLNRLVLFVALLPQLETVDGCEGSRCSRATCSDARTRRSRSLCRPMLTTTRLAQALCKIPRGVALWPALTGNNTAVIAAKEALSL